MDEDFDDFEDFDMDFDTDSMGTNPNDDRSATQKVVGDFSEGLLSEFNDDRAETLKDISSSMGNSMLGASGDKLSEGFSAGTDALESATLELKKSTRPFLKAIEKSIPKGGILEDIHGKLNDLLGDEEERVNKEEASENADLSEIRTLLGEKQSEEDKQKKLKERMDAIYSQTTLDATNKIAGFSRLSYDFTNNVTNNYYRKSLELKYRLVFHSKELIALTKQSNETVFKQLEGIVRNTGLPEFVKVKSIEAVKGAIRANVANKLGDNLFGKGSSIGDNVGKLVKNTSKSITGGLDMATGAIQQGDDMAEMGLSSGGLAASTASITLKEAVGKNLAARAKKNKLLGGMLSKFTGVLDDPTEALDNMRTKGGFLGGKMADVLGTIFDTEGRESSVMLEKDELSSSTFLDIRTKQSINDIMPAYLASIDAGIRSIASGKQEDSFAFDRDRGTLTTNKELSKNFLNELGKSNDQTSRNIQGILSTILKNSKTQLGQDEVTELKDRLYDFALSDKPLSSLNLAKNGFYDGLREKTAQAFKEGLDGYLHPEDNNGELDLDNKESLDSGLKGIRGGFNNPSKLIEEKIKDGQIGNLKDLGVVTYNESLGIYEVDMKKVKLLQKKNMRDSVRVDTTGNVTLTREQQELQDKIDEKLKEDEENSILGKAKKFADEKKKELKGKAKDFIDNNKTITQTKEQLEKRKKETIAKVSNLKTEIISKINYPGSIEEVKASRDKVFDLVKDLNKEDATKIITDLNKEFEKSSFVKLGKMKLNKAKDFISSNTSKETKDKITKWRKDLKSKKEEIKIEINYDTNLKELKDTRDKVFTFVKDLDRREASRIITKVGKDLKEFSQSSNKEKTVIGKFSKKNIKKAKEKASKFINNLDKKRKIVFETIKDPELRAVILENIDTIDIKDVKSFAVTMNKKVNSNKESIKGKGNHTREYIESVANSVASSMNNLFNRNGDKENSKLEKLEETKVENEIKVQESQEDRDNRLTETLNRLEETLDKQGKEPRANSVEERRKLFSTNIDGKKKDKKDDGKDGKKGILGKGFGLIAGAAGLALSTLPAILGGVVSTFGTIVTVGGGLIGIIGKMGLALKLATGAIMLMGKGIGKVMSFGADSGRTGRVLKKGKGFLSGVGKALKWGLKKLPGAGLVIGGGLAINELINGNMGAAGLEMASGILSSIPIVGGIASSVLDMNKENILRDEDRDGKIEESLTLTKEAMEQSRIDNNTNNKAIINTISSSGQIGAFKSVKELAKARAVEKNTSSTLSTSIKDIDTRIKVEGKTINETTEKLKLAKQNGETDKVATLKVELIEQGKKLNNSIKERTDKQQLLDKSNTTSKKLNELDKKVGTLLGNNGEDEKEELLKKSKLGDSGFLKGDVKLVAYAIRMMESRNDYSETGILKDGAGISFGAYQLTQKALALKKFMNLFASLKHSYSEEAKMHNKLLKGASYRGNRGVFMNWLRGIGKSKMSVYAQDVIFLGSYVNPVIKKIKNKGKDFKNPYVIAHLIDQNVTGGANYVIRHTSEDTERAIMKGRNLYYSTRKPELRKLYLKGWLARVRNFSTLLHKFLGREKTNPKGVSFDESDASIMTPPMNESNDTSRESSGNLIADGIKATLTTLLSAIGIDIKDSNGKGDSVDGTLSDPTSGKASTRFTNSNKPVNDGTDPEPISMHPEIHDWRTNIRYSTLGPDAKLYFIGFSQYMKVKGIKLMIGGKGGNRSYEDQAKLFAQGRNGDRRPKVTWTKTNSRHIGGRAIDILSSKGYGVPKENYMIAKEMRTFAQAHPELGAVFLKLSKDPNHVEFPNAKPIDPISAEDIILRGRFTKKKKKLEKTIAKDNKSNPVNLKTVEKTSNLKVATVNGSDGLDTTGKTKVSDAMANIEIPNETTQHTQATINKSKGKQLGLIENDIMGTTKDGKPVVEDKTTHELLREGLMKSQQTNDLLMGILQKENIITIPETSNENKTTRPQPRQPIDVTKNVISTSKQSY